jgi:hypothetical protein
MAAWGWFATLTVVFGWSGEIAVEALHIGHQAREIATHALVTLPLAFGIIAWLRRATPPRPETGPLALDWYHFALVVAIPLYLVVATKFGDVIESGQDEAGMAALVAAHFFEHTLDYVFVGLLIAGVYGLMRARAQMGKEEALTL